MATDLTARQQEILDVHLVPARSAPLIDLLALRVIHLVARAVGGHRADTGTRTRAPDSAVPRQRRPAAVGTAGWQCEGR